MEIGILLVATNKYTKFLQPFIDSCEKYFLKNHSKKYFIFSNHTIDIKNSKCFFIEHQPFPTPTLMRYHYFISQIQEYDNCDYLFYSDVDMLFVDDVDEEVLSDITVVTHPGFYNKNINNYSYERRNNSTAYIPIGEGKAYYAGGFQGGKKNNFINMSNTIKKNIDIDTKQGLIAVWHDESHMNKYMFTYTGNVKILDPGYCYPESWDLPFTKKLLALDKNHEEVRSL